MTTGMDFASQRPPTPVDIIFRYLGDSSAALTKAEATAYLSAGKQIAPTFEQGGTQAEGGYGQGRTDAAYANDHANRLNIPEDVWIWYAVDTSATADQVRPYFEGIKEFGGRPAGIYGPMGTGLTLRAEGRVEGVWIANAASWSGYRSWDELAIAARASVAHVLQHVDKPLAGVNPGDYDFDEILKPFPTWGADGTVNGPPTTRKGHEMFQLFQFSDAPPGPERAAVWATNGTQRSWVQSPASRDALILIASLQGLPTNIAQLTMAQANSIPVVGPTP